MKPTSFKGQTIVLQKPAGMTDEQCGQLAILQLNGTCISKWKLSIRERIKIIFTGAIWIGVLSGETQPPIFAEVHQPFKDEDANAMVEAKQEKETCATHLTKKYGNAASKKAEALLKSGIKPPHGNRKDPRWNFTVEKWELEDCQKHGIGSLFGMKLVGK